MHLNGKYVAVSGKRVGCAHSGRWVWTERAASPYSPETMAMAKACADAGLAHLANQPPTPLRRFV